MEEFHTQKVVAVDFDGTIVENKYPQIGKERLFAFQTLKAMQEKGYLLVLWTCRTGQELTDAIEFCKKGGIEFYAVNSNYEGEVYDPQETGCPARKLTADIFIDDRNYGGLPSWGQIYQELVDSGASNMPMPQRKGLLGKLLGK